MDSLALTLVNDKRYTEKFIYCVIKQIKLNISINLDDEKLNRVTKYLERVAPHNGNLILTDGQSIIIEGIKSITYEKIETEEEKGFRIFIDDKRFFQHPYCRVIDLVKLVDVGNLELEAYPIFSEAFKDAKKNLNKIYYTFECGGGIFYECLPI